MRLRKLSIAFSLLLAASSAARAAAPLADRVPADAVAYAGWVGQGQVKNYEGSHLQGVLAASNAPKVVTDFLPKVFERIAREDRRNAAAWRAIGPVVGQVGKYPSAVFFGGMAPPPDRRGGPLPKLGLVVRSGAETKALFDQVNRVLTATTASQVKLAEAGDHLVVAVGYGPEEMAAWLKPGAAGPGGLAAADGFKAAAAQVATDPAVVTYLDVEKLIALTEQAAAQSSGPGGDDSQDFKAFLDASGLRGAKRYISTGAIDGRDWVTQTFVDAPGPREGLLSLVEPGAVSDDLLRSVPADATYVKAGKFDPAKALRVVRDVVAKVNPEAGKQFDQALGAATMYVGRNVQNDVLEPLGTDWALYFSPTVAGTGLYGVVVVNKLDDPAKAAQSMQAVSFAINNGLATAMRREKWKIPGRQVKVGDVSVYYVGTPFMSPAWAVANGNLYLGLYPQSVAAAARRDGGGATAPGGKSILDNPQFVAARKQLGDRPAGGLTYADIPTLAGQGWGYQYAMILSRTALGFGDVFGVESPELVLPPLDALLPHLAPAARAAWAADDGFHAVARQPFPGASLLTEQGIASQAGVGYTSLATSILLPSLNKARETANRVKCASNLRQMGVACMLFANENRGRYPADLGEMLRTQDIGVEVFVCPAADDEIPADVRAGTIEQKAKWVIENSHYVYLGGGKNNSIAPDAVLAYERDENHGGDGMNMLFGDGHVEWVTMDRAQKLIEEQNAAPGEP